MKKILLIFTVTLIFITSTSASVNHEVWFDQEEVEINSSVKIECTEQCPVNRWNLDWQLPAGSEVVSVNGSAGEAEEVSREADTIQITTETPPQDSEVMDIALSIEREPERLSENFYRRQLSLPGLEGEETRWEIQNEEIISATVGNGFETAFNKEDVRGQGEGPIEVTVNSGSGEKTDYYVFSGQVPDEEVDTAFELASGTLGIVQSFERFPVLSVEDQVYNESINDWSSGIYRSGTIKLREGLGEDFLPVLTHETVHGINHEYMDWDRTGSVYFDEGTAEYAEFLKRKMLYRSNEIDVGPSEVFGEEREYEVEKDDGRVVYTRPPQGEREELWNYYQLDDPWMKHWNLRDFPEQREFGYAYSRLVVMSHMKNEGSLRDIYSSMEFNSSVEDPERKWEFFDQHMEMRPCDYDDRDRFDDCLNKINDYDYPLYMSSPEIGSEEIEINQHELPERNRSLGSGVIDTDRIGIQESYIEDMRVFWSSVMDMLFSSLHSVLN